MGIGRPNFSVSNEVYAEVEGIVTREVFKATLHMDVLLRDENEMAAMALLMKPRDRRALKAVLTSYLRRDENGNLKGGHALLKGVLDDANDDGLVEITEAQSTPPPTSA